MNAVSLERGRDTGPSQVCIRLKAEEELSEAQRGAWAGAQEQGVSLLHSLSTAQGRGRLGRAPVPVLFCRSLWLGAQAELLCIAKQCPAQPSPTELFAIDELTLVHFGGQ
jgi:hypothetical protein